MPSGALCGRKALVAVRTARLAGSPDFPESFVKETIRTFTSMTQWGRTGLLLHGHTSHTSDPRNGICYIYAIYGSHPIMFGDV
jgi:hypothetical protein